MVDSNDTENEEGNSGANVASKAKLAQLAKRKKVPIQLDRIVDCLHYRVRKLTMVKTSCNPGFA